MVEITIKPPVNVGMDYDYIAFSFNGKHSYEDFGLVRTSTGNRYDFNLTPAMNERTADVPNGDGTYYFGTFYKSQEFPISFAFDHLTYKELNEMKGWLDGKELRPLWFAEEPYKVYMAKVSGQPVVKAVPFDEEYVIEGVTKTRRVYKGEGSVKFVAYNPIARTPDYVDRIFYSYNLVPGQDNCNLFQTSHRTSSGDRVVFYKIEDNKLVEASVSNVYTWSGVADPQKRDNALNKDDRGYILSGIVSGISLETDETSLVVIIHKKNGEKTFPEFAQRPYTRHSGYGVKRVDGHLAQAYDDFSNKEQWIEASGLTDTGAQYGGTEPGPVEASFYGWEEITLSEAEEG